MSTLAAVMTGAGTGAISTIQVFGEKSEAVIKKIFKSSGTKQAVFKPGQILLGVISDGSEVIDQVTIGCEDAKSYAINCHGNPLIIEMIMRLLGKYEVQLVTAEKLLTNVLSESKSVNTIGLEAKLAELKAQTVEGVKIIANQIEGGLNKKLEEWHCNIDTISLAEIAAEAERILKVSQKAKLIIYGCTAVIAGPANSGKSTLLNCLAGKQKAIVTDIKGTTRDWVSSRCQMGPLLVELIDTAGLDEGLTEAIEKESQQRSVRILEDADLVLLVLDSSEGIEQLDEKLVKRMGGKKVLTVLNKADLPAKLDSEKLPSNLIDAVQISAKLGSGIEKLIEKIQQVCGVGEIDFGAAVCVTGRQEKLLNELSNAKSTKEAASVITELLNGQVCV